MEDITVLQARMQAKMNSLMEVKNFTDSEKFLTDLEEMDAEIQAYAKRIGQKVPAVDFSQLRMIFSMMQFKRGT